jgi:hypothetical protein
LDKGLTVVSTKRVFATVKSIINLTIMELTIDQALQQGIAAHKAGKVQEAERLYRAILGSHPKHPDANHNLGLLTVSIGEMHSSLPYFKVAIESNPTLNSTG